MIEKYTFYSIFVSDLAFEKDDKRVSSTSQPADPPTKMSGIVDSRNVIEEPRGGAPATLAGRGG
jgi:hypothetical protein